MAPQPANGGIATCPRNRRNRLLGGHDRHWPAAIPVLSFRRGTMRFEAVNGVRRWRLATTS